MLLLPSAALASPHHRTVQRTESQKTPTAQAQSLLSEEQALAKNYSSDLTSLFEFQDQAPPNSGVSPETKFKVWSRTDQETVLRVLSRIYAVAPGLIVSAASMDKIHLYKAEHLQVVKYGHLKQYEDVPGVSLVSGIALSENFFNRQDQFEFLAHELTHRADFGGRICYSKEWCEFAAPQISKLRLQHQLLSQHESWRLDRRLRKNSIWPSLYGTENVQEALAEYVTAFIHNGDLGFTPDPKFLPFAKKVLVPSRDDMLWAHYVRQGTLEYQRKHFDDAIAALHKAVAIDSNNPYLHDYLSLSYAALDKNDQALTESLESMRLFDANEVPRWDSTRLSAELVQANLLEKANKYAQLKDRLDEILVQLPNDLESYGKRAQCLEEMEQYSDAANDLYSGSLKTVWTNSFNPLASDAEQSFKEKLIDQFVLKQPRSDSALRMRAQYKTMLADKEINPQRREQLYLSALQDVENSLGSADCSEVAGLTQCARLRIKLGDIEGAKRDYQSAVNLDKDAIETHILAIKLSELSGDKQAAKAEYLLVKFLVNSPMVVLSKNTYSAPSVSTPLPQDAAAELTDFLNGKSRRLTGIDTSSGAESFKNPIDSPGSRFDPWSHMDAVRNRQMFEQVMQNHQ